MRSLLVLGVLIALMVALLAAIAYKTPPAEEDSHARIAVVIDRTRSFEENLQDAATIVGRFVRENALAGDSEVYLISLDREPSVLHFYRAEELLDSRGSKILDEIKSANPLDGTDVVGALQLAAMKLHKNTRAKITRRILLCFSDMHVDPATIPVRKEFKRLKEFDWSTLKQAECHFFFVAPENERVVIGLLEQNGITGEVMTPEESRGLVADEILDTVE